jgi:hypothetical protein
MELDFDSLSNEQKSYVLKYATVHKKLTGLQEEMEDIDKRIKETIKELELIREDENKIFNNGKKE